MTLSQFDRKEMATVTATTRMVLDFLPTMDNVKMSSSIGCSDDRWNKKRLPAHGLIPPPPPQRTRLSNEWHKTNQQSCEHTFSICPNKLNNKINK